MLLPTDRDEDLGSPWGGAQFIEDILNQLGVLFAQMCLECSRSAPSLDECVVSLFLCIPVKFVGEAPLIGRRSFGGLGRISLELGLGSGSDVNMRDQSERLFLAFEIALDAFKQGWRPFLDRRLSGENYWSKQQEEQNCNAHCENSLHSRVVCDVPTGSTPTPSCAIGIPTNAGLHKCTPLAALSLR